MRWFFILIALVMLPGAVEAQDNPGATIPKILLLGDSIRLSYTSQVKQTLGDEVTIVSPKANGGDSGNLLKNIRALLVQEQPQLVHFNCGIHDIKKFKTTGNFQVSPEQYAQNLRAIVNEIRDKTKATVVFATTTPILDDRAAKARAERNYELLDKSVEQYNSIARQVMQELKVPVNDLNKSLTVTDQPLDELISVDGVHLTSPGTRIAGTQVADTIRQELDLETTADGPWKIDQWKEIPKVTWLDRESPIHSLTFRNEPYRDVPTEVFAFYATPGTISGDATKDENLPIVVLIHGGGGTAFAEWVWLWAERGYAAIAMDLSGRRPEAPRFHPTTGELVSNLRTKRTRLERGGPEADHTSKFDNIGGDVTDDWQYHAVAAVMRAHSLVRSFPEVDGERSAVTGISWGGYMTCLVASLDSRFKAAVPVYGCGFLYEGESVQKPLIDKLNEAKRRQWIRMYDPSAWLPQCSVPILFVNGTNDKHYPLDSYMRSYELVPRQKQIRIEPGMRHSHVHGWAPVEIGQFVDQHLLKTTPLPSLDALRISGRKMTVAVSSMLPIKQAQLCFTTDSGLLSNRRWQSVSATVEDGQITSIIPKGATVWFVTVTDSRDAMVSSTVQLVE